MNSNLILNQPGFVLANAKALAQFSEDAYLPEAPRPFSYSASGSMAPVVCDLDDASTDTHVTITENDDCIVIAFRGTRDLRNWITDCEIQKRKAESGKAETGWGRVHRGFLEAIDAVLPAIVTRLKSKASSPKPVIVTGHSLGGALAVLCAFFLEHSDLPVHSVYTFGQPRVGDALFAAAANVTFGHKHFRIVDQCDIVCRLPGWLIGYRHSGQHCFITVADALVMNPDLLTIALNDALGAYAAYRTVSDVVIEDHFMGNYLAALGKLN